MLNGGLAVTGTVGNVGLSGTSDVVAGGNGHELSHALSISFHYAIEKHSSIQASDLVHSNHLIDKT